MDVRQLENARGTPNQSIRPADEGRTTGRAVFGRLWSNWRVGLVVAATLVVGFGLVSAWLTPRGPTTTAEALVSMAIALAIGIGAGLVTGNRWSLLVAPGVFVIVFEVARIGVVGPTVDAINLGSFYGIVAFVLGRVVHGILVLLPMILGAGLGVALAGRFGNEAAGTMGITGWVLSGLTTVALAAAAFFIAIPASTAPILGPDGQSLDDSVAELTTVSIGGHDLTMMIRGRSVDNPVLLYLAGLPGGTDLGAMRRDTTLEQNFVVVTWDRRGSGKSYSALDPTDSFTVDQEVADTIEVTNYLRDRFGEEKIYLVGQSGGTTIGGLAVQLHPELYHAFVGVGQMVSQRETDIMFWEDTLTWAEQTGNTTLADTLRQIGPPPYDDIRLYESAIANEHDWNPYPEFDSNNEMPAILFVPEYTWMDRINALRGFLDVAATQYPQLQNLDFRQDLTRLEVPFYMVQGEHEARGRAVLAEEWFAMLDAPSKEVFVFEGSGHRPNFDRPGDFAEVMSDVLEQSSPAASPEATTP
ncbi:MAG TPA: alpha/beta fold hydrolase [Acidimicrobiia bacterium]